MNSDPPTKLRRIVISMIVASNVLLMLFPTGHVPFVELRFVLVGFVCGTLLSQCTLAAGWAAFGGLPLRVRIPLSMAWALAGVMALLVNAFLRLPGGSIEDMIVTALVLCGAALTHWMVVQIPCWLVVAWLGVSIGPAGASGSSQSRSVLQFGIRELLIATTLIAMALGLGRVILLHVFTDEAQAVQTLVAMFAVVAFLVVSSFLFTFPLLLAAFLPKNSVPAVIVVLLLVGLASIWEAPLFEHVANIPASGLLFVSINVFSSAWVLAYVAVARSFGCELSRRSKSILPPIAVSDTPPS